MKVSAQLRYATDPDGVFAMLTDPAFQDRKLAATGALSHEVSIDENGRGATIRTERQMPTDDVPDMVRSFVGTTLTLVQVERWEPPAADGSRSGTLKVEVLRAPVRLTGTLRLAPDVSAAGGSTGTVETMQGELVARIPLFGTKIEKSAEPVIQAAIAVEQRTGTAWLAER